MENITGVCTGSNFNCLSTINMALIVEGFKGDGRFDDSVWCVKMHYPYVFPYITPFSATRSVIVVRNPLDVIVSWFQICTTYS